MFQLEIEDTGKGIPADKVEAVLQGFSLKHRGEGLGLSGAKKYIESMGGEIKLLSCVDQGSKVTLTLPLSPKPDWLPEKIIFCQESLIIILDDDASIHNLWRHRLQSLGLQTLHFVSSNKIIEWYYKNPNFREKAYYLIDFELKNPAQNGLNIFAKFNIKSRGYLITSHAEEVTIQQQCELLGINLIPKILIGEIILEHAMIS